MSEPLPDLYRVEELRDQLAELELHPGFLWFLNQVRLRLQRDQALLEDSTRDSFSRLQGQVKAYKDVLGLVKDLQRELNNQQQQPPMESVS